MSAFVGGSWLGTTWLFHYSNIQGVDLTEGQYVTQAYADCVEDAQRNTGASLDPPPAPVFRRAFLVETELLDDQRFFSDEPSKSTAVGAGIFRLKAPIEARHMHDEPMRT